MPLVMVFYLSNRMIANTVENKVPQSLWALSNMERILIEYSKCAGDTLKNHTAHEEHKIEHAWESDHQIWI